MDPEQLHHLDKIVLGMLSRNLPDEAFQWLTAKGDAIRTGQDSKELNAGFSAVPRKVGRQVSDILGTESAQVTLLLRGFSVNDWPVDRLSRLWLLMRVDASDRDRYVEKISALFRNAEMNELVALYASMPAFAYPEAWIHQATEGIRSNIGSVLEAIMYANPYPAIYLDEAAWNQLVLKAFFTEKDVRRIYGLDERANERLAAILVDYAHERGAAGRTVPPSLWRLVSRFINETTLPDLRKLLESPDAAERKAAALACYHAPYEPARKLLADKPELIDGIRHDVIRWENL